MNQFALNELIQLIHFHAQSLYVFQDVEDLPHMMVFDLDGATCCCRNQEVKVNRAESCTGRHILKVFQSVDTLNFWHPVSNLLSIWCLILLLRVEF